jgi:hypothetical protein
MRFRGLPLGLLLGLILWAIIAGSVYTAVTYAEPGGPGGAPLTITSQPQIQLDLALAQAYWQIEVPVNPLPACLPMTVEVQALDTAVGNDGTPIPVTSTAAETQIDSCRIFIAPAAWTAYGLHQGDPPFPAQPVTAAEGRYMLCAILTHEYGHTLGLQDLDDNTMLNADPTVTGREQPLCATVYEPDHLTGYEKRWLDQHA